MKKLLYINNYNCTNLHKEGYPDNHLWGVDALSRIYKVKCAKVPGNLFKITFKGSARINNFWKSLVMLIRYFNYDTVYSACGDLTDAFALANILRLKHRRLFMIQHHGTSRILFPKGYTKIIFKVLLSKSCSHKYPILASFHGGRSNYLLINSGRLLI